MDRRFRPLLVGLAVLVGAEVVGTTDARGDTIVVESYVGTRPQNAGRLMAPVLDELQGRGYQVGPALVGSAIEETGSLSGGSMTSAQRADAQKLVEKGYKAWLNGEFESAASTLLTAIRLFRANVAAVAQDQTLHKDLQRALVGYAMAKLRLGDTVAADGTMAEFIRSFPDIELSRATYGPEAHELYQRVRKLLDKRGKGTLVVRVDDPTAIIFLDERFEASGSMRKEKIWPGQYRVYVQRGQVPGRVHLIEVQPGKEAVLEIEWKFDAALTTTSLWTGFTFASVADRNALEGRFAARLARDLGATGVVVLGVESNGSRGTLFGAALNTTDGKPLRAGSVPLSPEPSAQRLRAFGRFLAGDEPSEWVNVAAEEPIDQSTPARPQALRSSWRYGGWKWASTGASLGAFALGAWLYSIDGNGVDCPPGPGACPRTIETTIGAVTALSAGVGLAAASVYLFMTDEELPVRVDATASRHGASIGLTWDF